MKYLIEIHHGLGDVVQITGLIDTLYRGDDKADIGVILYDSSRAGFFFNDPRVKHIYYLNIRSNSRMDSVKTVLEIRRYKYDYAFFSPISNRRVIKLLALIIAARNSFGEQLSDFSLPGASFHKVPAVESHIVVRNNNMLLATGLFETVLSPALVGLPLLKEYEKIGGKPMIGLCIGTSKPSKTWPLNNYIEVAKHFEDDFTIAFIGGKKEQESFPANLFSQHESWVDFLGKFNIMESAALTKMCKVVIGGDTGIMHIAAALNVPTVTIFSCSDPALHAPYSNASYVVTCKVDCQYCYEYGGYNSCTEYRCLNGITPDMVIQYANDALTGNQSTLFQIV